MSEISKTPETTLKLNPQHLAARVIVPPQDTWVEKETRYSYDQSRQLGDLKLQLQFSSEAAAVCGQKRFR
jgi:hypothetical protein